MKKVLTMTLAILMVLSTLSCLSVVSFAADEPTYEAEVEGNDTNVTAQGIEPGKTYAGRLSSNSDVDWYVFENVEDYFEVTLDHASDVNSGSLNGGWTISVYKQGDFENKLDFCEAITSAYTTPKLAFSGKIYVKVAKTAFEMNPDAYYSLKATTVSDEFWESEINDNSSSFNSIQTEKEYTGSLHSNSDTDWFVFENTEDYFELTISTADDISSGNIEGGWNIYIYRENDFVNYLDHCEGIITSYTTPKLPYSGKIYVKVTKTPYVNAPSANTYYGLFVETTADDLWESESNNTDGTSNTIAPSIEYTGSLLDNSDVDWFVFENKADYFAVALRFDEEKSSGELEGGWKISVYREADFANALVSCENIRTSYTTPKYSYTGKIYVKITNSSYVNAPSANTYYGLSVETTADNLWENESNDTSTASNAIVSGNTYIGSLHNNSDTDWYVFENTKDYFEVTISTAEAISTGDLEGGWNVYIYRENDFANYLDHCEGIRTSYTTPKLPYTGKIYVKVTKTPYVDAPSANTYYGLSVKTTANNLWESEDNDTVATANIINTQKTYTGALLSNTDADFYKLSSKDGYITFNLKCNASANTDNVRDGWTVNVYTNNNFASPCYTVNYIWNSFESVKIPVTGEVYLKISKAPFMEAPRADCYYDLTVTHTPATPKVATTNEIGGVNVTWNKIDGATKYVVFRRQAGYKTWVNVGTTTATSFLDKNVTSGVYYCYSVRAYNAQGRYSDFIEANTQTRKYMATPKLTTIYNHVNGLAIKWNAVAGVTNGYRVYRRGAGSTYWTYLGTTKNLYFIDSQVKAKSGEYFRYTVIADGGYHSKFDTTGLYLKRLENPALLSATSTSAGITVKWGAVKGTTGYYVYRKTANSNWVKIASVGGTNSTAYVDRGAVKGTTYTYTVRAVYGATTSAYNAGVSCYDKY